MTVRTQQRSIDPANPPAGMRLEIGSTINEVGEGGVSLGELAHAAGISKTAMWSIVGANEWPVRTDPQQIRSAVETLLRERGASDAQIATLWHAHLKNRQRNRPGHDYRNIPLGEDGKVLPPALRPRADKPHHQETDVLLAKQTLSPEARKHFELTFNPFDGEVETAEQMFTSGEIRFVRECCWQAAVGARFVGVVGESGSGKSTVLADLKERIAVDRKPVVVIEPSVLGMEDTNARGTKLRATDILTRIVMTLDPLSPVAQTMEKRTTQAERALAESTKAGNTHLLMIEEAHSLPMATIKHLKRLHERMRLNGRKPMIGILLLGQPELKEKLDERRHDVREVVQRIELIELQPLGNALKPYLQHRARWAGRELTRLLDEEAIEAIRGRLTVVPAGLRNAQPISLLYPLAVNNLVTAALNKAARAGAPLVTGDVVMSI